MLIPVHHSVHAPLTREATERFGGMADKLQEACFAERQRLEPELRPYFRVVELDSEALRQEIPRPQI
jgi:hypothetical protein